MITLFLVMAAAPTVLQAQTALANETVNPAAAQFRNVRVVGSVVCGEINSPNRQGGFSGFSRFAFYSAEPLTYATEEAGDYRLRENGRYTNTAQLIELALRNQGESERATGYMQEAEAGQHRGQALMAPCRGQNPGSW